MSRNHLFISMSVIFFSMHLSSCADFTLTAPLCGPGSADQSPEAHFPDAGAGCYESPVLDLKMGSSIIRPMTSETRDYIWIQNYGQRTVIGTSISQEFSPFGGLCKNPADNSGLSFLLSQKGTGWWSASYVTFSGNWDRIFFSNAVIDFGQLKNAGIRYALFPSANFRSKSDVKKGDAGPPLDSTLGIKLIDNKSIATSDLFDQLNISPAPVFITLKRVSKDHCMIPQMKFYRSQAPNKTMAWVPTITPF